MIPVYSANWLLSASTQFMTETNSRALPLVEANVAGQQHYAGLNFPLVYVASPTLADINECLALIQTQRQGLLLQLARHGAILFRGLPLATDLHFDAFIQAFDLPGFTYEESLSNAVRRNRTARVFTANEAPPSVAIYLHHEMAQTPLYPSSLFFFCEQAATSGGATPLCRSDVLLDALQKQLPDFVKDCATKGVRYANTMPGEEDLQSGQGRSWRNTLNAADRATAEARLKKLGYEWQWFEGDSLKVVTPVLPAVRQLADGRRVFFNQLIAAFRGWQDRRNEAGKSIRFGDGSPIPVEVMATVIELSDALTFDLQWQTGDVALVDNFLVMHGRRPYKGERRVLAALVA